MTKKLTGAKTPLERAVQRRCNAHAGDYESGVSGFLQDLAYGGCESGMVGDLIYYKDTCAFYKRHQREISDLLRDAMQECGCSCPKEVFGEKWDAEDPLGRHIYNQNLLAWFAFEETAPSLAEQNGMEL